MSRADGPKKGLLRAFGGGPVRGRLDHRRSGCDQWSVIGRERTPPAAPVASDIAVPFRQATSGTVSVSLLHRRPAAGGTRGPYAAFAAGRIRALSTGRL